MTESADAVYMGDIGDNFRDPAQHRRVPARQTVPLTPMTSRTARADLPGRRPRRRGAHGRPTRGRTRRRHEGSRRELRRVHAPVETAGELELVATLDLGVGPTGHGRRHLAHGRSDRAAHLRRRCSSGTARRANRSPMRSPREPCPAPAPQDAQGEAISFAPDGYVTISEGADAPIWRVTAAAAG